MTSQSFQGFTEGWFQKEEISSELQLCRGGCLVYVRTLDRMGRATVDVIYNDIS